MQGLTFGAVLLVGDADGGIDGFVQFVEWGRIGDGVAVGVAECHMADSEGLCVLFFVPWFGVFSNAKQKIKSDVD